MKTLALFCLLALPTLAADTTIVGKVVGVHDGDTLTLRTFNETLKVRLSGIDTPELGQPLGNNAKWLLSAVAIGTTYDQLHTYLAILFDLAFQRFLDPIE